MSEKGSVVGNGSLGGALFFSNSRLPLSVSAASFLEKFELYGFHIFDKPVMIITKLLTVGILELVRRYAGLASDRAGWKFSRRTALLNVVSLVGALSNLMFAAICLAAGAANFAPIIVPLVIFAIAWLLTPLTHRFGNVFAATYLWFTVGLCNSLLVALAGSDISAHYFFLAAPSVIVLSLGPKQYVRSGIYLAIYVVVFLACQWWAPSRTNLVDLPDWFASLSFAFSVIMTVSITFFASTYSLDRAEAAESALEFEYGRSEHLIHSLLPTSIAARLKANPDQIIADRFDQVTVLFADIVNFTERAAVTPPDALVGFLNRVFSEFDNLAEKHGVEKIKTIGDAYMVAAGLSGTANIHAATAVADMALEMLAVTKRLAIDNGIAGLEVRIGIDSGPVIAGVIGTQKLFYDVWGDTVNTASRMESLGSSGRIQVTENTAEALGATYKFERRGTLTVKGKGPMSTYYLLGHLNCDALI